MKSILLLSLTLFLVIPGYAAIYAEGDPIKIKKYTNDQTQALELETHFGQPLILNKRDLKKLEGQTIYHIDLVYTAYHESDDFDQVQLNENRIAGLKKLLPQVEIDQPNWTIYEQTGAMERKEAKQYFHGFVIHYGLDLSYKNQASFFTDLQKPFATIEIINETGGRVEYYTGSSIEIDAYSVTHQNGEQVKGAYTLYYREFRNEAEIALSGIPMFYNETGADEVFNSVGMYEIRAKKDGEDLILVQPLSVNFQCTGVLPEVGFFEMNEEGHWVQDGEVSFDADGLAEGSVYNINLDGFDAFGKEVKVMKFRPESEIDQGNFQGYTFVKMSQVIDEDQLFMGLSRMVWRKFLKLYETEDSIRDMVREVNEQSRSMLVFRESAEGFIEAVMGQEFEDLTVEKEKRQTIYKSGSAGAKKGLKNIVGDEPIPPSPGLVMGLRSSGFGVYNCDQTKRIEDPIVLRPTYYNRTTGEKLENLYVACVIDLNLNASLSYHPNNLVCNGAGNSKVLLFTRDMELFLFEKEGFKQFLLEDGAVDMKMKDITAEVENASDLQKVLGI